MLDPINFETASGRYQPVALVRTASWSERNVSTEPDSQDATRTLLPNPRPNFDFPGDTLRNSVDQGSTFSVNIEGLGNDLAEVTYEVVSGSDYARRPSQISGGSATGSWKWLDNMALLALVATILFVDSMALVIAAQQPDKQEQLQILQQLALIFYTGELICRFARRGICAFVCGSECKFWNWVDCSIVIAGVIDNFAKEPEDNPILNFLKAPLFLWILRLLRLMRLVMIADMSWVEASNFQSFIAFIIALNAVIMGLETDIEWSGWYWTEQGFLALFTFELMVHIKQQGLRNFFTEQTVSTIWNWLDFIIVFSGAFVQWIIPLSAPGSFEEKNFGELIMLLRILRLLRVLRLIRLVKEVRPLYIMVIGLAEGMYGAFWVVVLIFVVLYAFAILATRLIGHGLLWASYRNAGDSTSQLVNHIQQVFENVPNSMFNLFKIMNGDMTDVDMLFSNGPLGHGGWLCKLVFTFFMVCTSWGLISILSAVVFESMLAHRLDTQEEETKQRRRSDLVSLFTILDEDGSGDVDREEFQAFLEDEDCVKRLKEVVGSKPKEATGVFEALAANSKDGLVRMEDFVESLEHNTQPASKIAVMQLDGRITTLEDLLRSTLLPTEEQKQRRRQQLGHLFHELDADGSGEIDMDEFSSFVEDPECAEKLSKIVGVRPKEALAVFEAMTVQSGEDACGMEDFVESLMHQSEPASKVALYQVDHRLQNLEDMLRETLGALAVLTADKGYVPNARRATRKKTELGRSNTAPLGSENNLGYSSPKASPLPPQAPAFISPGGDATNFLDVPRIEQRPLVAQEQRLKQEIMHHVSQDYLSKKRAPEVVAEHAAAASHEQEQLHLTGQASLVSAQCSELANLKQQQQVSSPGSYSAEGANPDPFSNDSSTNNFADSRFSADVAAGSKFRWTSTNVGDAYDNARHHTVSSAGNVADYFGDINAAPGIGVFSDASSAVAEMIRGTSAISGSPTGGGAGRLDFGVEAAYPHNAPSGRTAADVDSATRISIATEMEVVQGHRAFYQLPATPPHSGRRVRLAHTEMEVVQAHQAFQHPPETPPHSGRHNRLAHRRDLGDSSSGTSAPRVAFHSGETSSASQSLAGASFASHVQRYPAAAYLDSSETISTTENLPASSSEGQTFVGPAAIPEYFSQRDPALSPRSMSFVRYEAKLL